MRLLFITFLLSFSFQLAAQHGGNWSGENLAGKFKSSTTYVLLTGNERFDENLINGFESFWTISEYEFVESEDEIDTKDVAVSYIVPFTYKVNDGYSTQFYNRYGLFMGGEGSNLENNITYILLDNFGYEKELVEAAYRAYGIPKLLQDYVQMKIDGEIVGTGTYSKMIHKVGAAYNKKNANIKKKTLLVGERLLKTGPYRLFLEKTFSKEKFEKGYDGKVKFVSTKELETAINERNPDYTYMLCINSRKKYVLGVDCESGSIWYHGYNPNERTIGLTTKNLSQFNKAVNR